MKNRWFRNLVAAVAVAVTVIMTLPLLIANATPVTVTPQNIIVPVGQDFVITPVSSNNYRVNFVGTDSEIDINAGTMTVSKWGGESTFSLTLPESISKTLKKVASTSSSVAWSNKDYIFTYSPTGIIEGFNEQGGMDLSITLKTKPSTNTLSFSFNATNVNAYLQPPLTPEEIAEGNVRPDHIVNSIAFYGNENQVNCIQGRTDYATGKIGHLFRLKDSEGRWADWSISGNTITLTFDQKTLDTATYPMTVAPIGDEFGITSVGGTSSGWGTTYWRGELGSAVAFSGEITECHIYTSYGVSDSYHIKPVITDSSLLILDSPSTSAGVGNAIDVSDFSPGWLIATFATNPAVVNGTTYYAGAVSEHADGAVNYYDTVTSGIEHARDTSNNYGTPTDPSDAAARTTKTSIHCLYIAVSPTVTTISPDWGSTAGGLTGITITGTNFAAGATVTIGGASATDVNVVSDTSLTCTTPTGTAGRRDVVVTVGGQNGTLTNGFCYVAPVTNVSTVDETTNTNNWAIRIPFQSKIFVAATRTWAFYEDNGSIYFKSTTDGIIWNTRTLIASGYQDYEFASYWSGTHITIIYAKQSANAHMYYRRGTPQSGGTITWDYAAADIYTPTVGASCADFNITVNSGGYDFIFFCMYASNVGSPHCLKNANNDGTWSLDTDTTLDTRGSSHPETAHGVALTSNKVYTIYAVMSGSVDEHIYGKLWDSGWGAEETASTSHLDQAYFDMFGTVATGDDVNLIFNKETSTALVYVKRTYGVGWGAETTVMTGTTDQTAPTISANGTNLAVFWLDTVKLYVKNCLSGVWDTDPTTVADETTNTMRGVSSIQSTRTVTSYNYGILYEIRTATPNFVRYVKYTIADPPTITISAATDKEATTATLNGNITVTGGENPTVTVYWGDNDGGQTPGSWDNSSAPTSPAQPQGVASFYKSATSLPTGTTIYFSAKATNSGGTAWASSSLSFLTKPAAPTGVAATDGSETSKVVVTWTKSTGATDYHVWRGAVDLGAAGDVATLDDTGADASVITQGNSVAGDGSSTAHVALSLSGTSIANGTSYTYKVVASNATGNSADSATDTGYRGHGTLGYQWQMSAGDSDASYSDIVGATASTYNATEAPAPTVTQGTASATDGFYTDKVTLSISGASANIGAGRYFQCNLTATGCVNKTATANRGYRGVGSLTYQWKRSDANSDQDFNTNLGTTDPYDDVTAPAPSITKGTASATDGDYSDKVTLSLAGESANNGTARYYYCVVSATGAVSQDTNHNQGYIGVGTLLRQWQRSLADSDEDYSNIDDAETDPYDDTGGATEPSGRYYRCVLNATGAAQQTTDGNRGYMSAESPGSGISKVSGISNIAKVIGTIFGNITKIMGISK